MAGWRGPKTATSRDPLLSVAAHRRRNRNHWIRSGRPCALCGRALVYDKTLRYIGGRQNPAYLVVGHVVSRYHAKLMGWSDAEMNSLGNTRPECTACSNKSGAQLGQKVQRSRYQVRLGRTDADRW
jgi:hypothetical protein